MPRGETEKNPAEEHQQLQGSGAPQPAKQTPAHEQSAEHRTGNVDRLQPTNAAAEKRRIVLHKFLQDGEAHAHQKSRWSDERERQNKVKKQDEARAFQ